MLLAKSFKNRLFTPSNRLSLILQRWGAVSENQSSRCATVYGRGRRKYNAGLHNSGHTNSEVEIQGKWRTRINNKMHRPNALRSKSTTDRCRATHLQPHGAEQNQPRWCAALLPSAISVKRQCIGERKGAHREEGTKPSPPASSVSTMAAQPPTRPEPATKSGERRWNKNWERLEVPCKEKEEGEGPIRRGAPRHCQHPTRNPPKPSHAYATGPKRGDETPLVYCFPTLSIHLRPITGGPHLFYFPFSLFLKLRNYKRPPYIRYIFLAFLIKLNRYRCGTWNLEGHLHI